MNKIICGDCLEAMRKMHSNSVDLIYLDPPFSSSKQYVGFWQKTGEKLVFDDHWESGVRGYIEWLTPRIEECRRVLKDTGSLYLHCDWHANAHIRIMMDKVFGVNNFRNEIVWQYAQSIKRSSNKFLSNHDIILFYSKQDKYVFNPQENLYTKKQLERFKHEDEDGKFYYDTRRDKIGNKKKVKVYLHKEGTPVGSVWYYPRTQGKERLGYPTQKPEALLERIIKASSNEGDIVLDPFCGCGTTLAVASKLNRNFIGIDVSRLSVKVMDNRLKKIRNLPKVTRTFVWELKIPNTINTIKEYGWFNFQTWVNEKLGAEQGKRGADGGIDGITWHQYTPVPCNQRKKIIPVKRGTLIQSKHYHHGSIGEPDLKKFKSTIEHNDKKEGVMVGWKFAKPNAYEFVLWAKEKGINIYLLKADELYKLETLESPYKEDYKEGQQMRVDDEL